MLKRIKNFLSTLVAFFLAINVSIAHAENEKQFSDATLFDPTKIPMAAKGISGTSNVPNYTTGVGIGLPYTASKDGFICLTVYDDEQGGDGGGAVVMDYKGKTSVISETYSRYRHRDTIWFFVPAGAKVRFSDYPRATIRCLFYLPQ